MYQYRCDKCGANLDPGEHCGCEEEADRERKLRERHYRQEAGSGQLAFSLDFEKEGHTL